eukprot:5401223-Amphidinium_carterae.1
MQAGCASLHTQSHNNDMEPCKQLNEWNFDDPQSYDLRRHVGMHPGIIQGCFEHPGFTPLVQWLIPHLSSAGIGEAAPPR